MFFKILKNTIVLSYALQFTTDLVVLPVGATVKIICKIFTAIVLVSISFTSAAYTVDIKRYFAYFEKPGRVHKGVSVPTMLMLLSKQKCSAKGAPNTAMLGAIVYLNRGGFVGETPACWYKEKWRGDDAVVLCTTLGNEMDSGAASCHFVSPSLFINVDSLPNSADFTMPTELTGKAKELVDRLDSLNTKCRSNPDASQACDQREASMRELRNLGWCWGPDDVPGYEKRWIRCQ